MTEIETEAAESLHFATTPTGFVQRRALVELVVRSSGAVHHQLGLLIALIGVLLHIGQRNGRVRRQLRLLLAVLSVQRLEREVELFLLVRLELPVAQHMLERLHLGHVERVQHRRRLLHRVGHLRAAFSASLSSTN